MSFAAMLAKVSGKRPFWLYTFTRDGTTTRLTSSGADIEHGGNTYTSTPITHTRIMRTSALNRMETQLVLPQSSAFAQSFLDASIGANTVTIEQGFAEDPDGETVVKFRGRVIGAEPRWTRITLLCENRMSETRRKAQPAVMQKLCRHALYSSACGVNLADFQIDGTLTAISGKAATVTGVYDPLTTPAGYYSGGILEWDGKRQLILRQSIEEFTLLAPIPGMAEALEGSPGTTPVKVAPGCSLNRNTCSNRFNNSLNFGGFPFIKDSPFDRSVF